MLRLNRDTKCTEVVKIVYLQYVRCNYSITLELSGNIELNQKIQKASKLSNIISAMSLRKLGILS